MSNSKYQESLDRAKELYTYLCDEFNLKKTAVKMNDDIEVLQELVDKATPKKPIKIRCEPNEEWDKEEVFYECPNCGEPLPYNFDYDYPIKNKCCLEWQQVLNWGGFDGK